MFFKHFSTFFHQLIIWVQLPNLALKILFTLINDKNIDKLKKEFKDLNRIN